MIFTIEPGLYFQPDDTTVPPEWRGIGVRIEDNIVVTKSAGKTFLLTSPRARQRSKTGFKKVQTLARLGPPAGVVKLADTQDLGSCAFGRVGSSPTFRTEVTRKYLASVVFYKTVVGLSGSPAFR
jgi:hypothetical protein